MNTVAASSHRLAQPSVADVFVHEAARIHRAAAAIWPSEPVCLERHIPSVTGYVHRARVGERRLYAKTSLLGVSLVSLLRGVRGPWHEVLRAQRAYGERPDGLIQREAAQLRLLAELGGPRVCRLVGLSSGVIFTEPVPGPTLGELLVEQPGDTVVLLDRIFAELRPLHRAGAARRLATSGVIEERSIASTFLRKFNGLSGTLYADRLGSERCESEQRQEVVRLVHRAVSRLGRLRMRLPSAGGTSLAYGDLKPDHVVFPGGADGRPVFLDPGLLRASRTVDIAKLVSRTVLALAAWRPGAPVAGRVLQGLDAFVESQVPMLSGRERHLWLRNLLVLWLMDTVNILTTYLSAPVALPLPPVGAALVDRAVPVFSMVESASADLETESALRDTWNRALDGAQAVAS
ncbi:phosphotransferase [Streptomyces broussonetiae]|uniref:Phosphotransferase n=1 Tax=Streptomyces broussonetiae TaxID=2686304 RepID=A0A6I6NI87_9ACTN|nr:phosphotransferase [Streptomyces broussonetiae]QHA10000.1 phosphotransferase [Streptomyces broussonetiae]